MNDIEDYILLRDVIGAALLSGEEDEECASLMYSAIVKRIPKKVVKQNAGELCHCPDCGTHIENNSFKYCTDCGQALKWEN